MLSFKGISQTSGSVNISQKLKFMEVRIIGKVVKFNSGRFTWFTLKNWSISGNPGEYNFSANIRNS